MILLLKLLNLELWVISCSRCCLAMMVLVQVIMGGRRDGLGVLLGEVVRMAGASCNLGWSGGGLGGIYHNYFPFLLLLSFYNHYLIVNCVMGHYLCSEIPITGRRSFMDSISVSVRMLPCGFCV